MMQRTSAKSITDDLLRGWPLPTEVGGDKESRGRVLVVAGMRTIPGAAILAGIGALRAGAGKLQLAAPASVAMNIAVHIPEALVEPFDETRDGAPSLNSVETVKAYAKDAAAIVLGPGMAPNDTCADFICALLSSCTTPVVLDASALFALKRDGSIVSHLGGAAVLTPHAAELAHLIDEDQTVIESNAARYAAETAKRFSAVVALKGATTYIASPDGSLYVNENGHIGLATSGSGDVLAGIIGGLAARGAEARQAAVWGVALHARAGAALGSRIGLGFLAREILPEIPVQMRNLQ